LDNSPPEARVLDNRHIGMKPAVDCLDAMPQVRTFQPLPLDMQQIDVAAGNAPYGPRRPVGLFGQGGGRRALISALLRVLGGIGPCRLE
jgi:hypothetical protein